MKNYYLLVGLLCAVQSITAQTPYCYEQDTIVPVGSESYYIIDKLYQFEIINTNYTLYDLEPIDWQGNVVLPDDYIGADVDTDSFVQAFIETFSAEEISLLRDGSPATRINIYVTKNNVGVVLEVVLSIWKTPITTAIPPEQWILYEQNLKRYVKWKGVTKDEQNLQFMHQYFRIDKRALQKRFPRREINPDADIITP